MYVWECVHVYQWDVHSSSCHGSWRVVWTSTWMTEEPPNRQGEGSEHWRAKRITCFNISSWLTCAKVGHLLPKSQHWLTSTTVSNYDFFCVSVCILFTEKMCKSCFWLCDLPGSMEGRAFLKFGTGTIEWWRLVEGGAWKRQRVLCFSSRLQYVGQTHKALNTYCFISPSEGSHDSSKQRTCFIVKVTKEIAREKGLYIKGIFSDCISFK